MAGYVLGTANRAVDMERKEWNSLGELAGPVELENQQQEGAAMNSNAANYSGSDTDNTGASMSKTGIAGWDPVTRFGIPPVVVMYSAFFVGVLVGVATWLLDPDPVDTAMIANVLPVVLAVVVTLGIIDLVGGYIRAHTGPAPVALVVIVDEFGSPLAVMVDQAAEVVSDWNRTAEYVQDER